MSSGESEFESSLYMSQGNPSLLIALAILDVEELRQRDDIDIFNRLVFALLFLSKDIPNGDEMFIPKVLRSSKPGVEVHTFSLRKRQTVQHGLSTTSSKPASTFFFFLFLFLRQSFSV